MKNCNRDLSSASKVSAGDNDNEKRHGRAKTDPLSAHRPKKDVAETGNIYLYGYSKKDIQFIY